MFIIDNILIDYVKIIFINIYIKYIYKYIIKYKFNSNYISINSINYINSTKLKFHYELEVTSLEAGFSQL